MPDPYEPWQRLVPIVVLGRVFHVPDNNMLLRQLQFVAEEVGTGRYCWNAECGECEVGYRLAGDPAEHSGFACRLRGTAGMQLTRLAPELLYNLSAALAAAPIADPAAGPLPTSR